MKLYAIAPLLFALILAPAAAAPSKPKPNIRPAINLLLSRSFEMVDLEGACAKQTCETMNPDHTEDCTDAKIAEYRPQCAAIMRRSGMKAHEDVKLEPEIAQKLEEAMAQAKGLVTREMAESMMGGEGDLDVEGVERVMREAGHGTGELDIEKMMTEAAGGQKYEHGEL